MREKEIWDDWVKQDEDGFACGIREDAPEDVKEAYNEYMRKKKESFSKNEWENK